MNKLQKLAKESGAKIADLSKINPKAVGLATKYLANKYLFIPIKFTGNTITIAMTSPYDLNAIDTLGYVLHHPITKKCALAFGNELNIQIAYKTHIKKAIRKFSGYFSKQ